MEEGIQYSVFLTDVLFAFLSSESPLRIPFIAGREWGGEAIKVKPIIIP
jgi:hypothetical protein